MYMPPAFEEKDTAVLWEVVRAHPLGLLISAGEGGLLANAVPFQVKHGVAGTILQAHLAKANAQWRSVDGQDVLAVFQGANAYVSPQWYESKKEHGRVVPTWNYAIVQVRGRARVIEDRNWLLQQVSELTGHHEGHVLGGHAWGVGDAPAEFINGQLKGIVGLEVSVTEVTGKFKVSQNRPVSDREGVAGGLERQGGEANLAMARLVKERF